LTPQQFIEQRLQQRRESGAYRQLKLQNNLIDFCSNDYLGFARSTHLKQLIQNELDAHQHSLNGSAGSRLLTGNTQYAEDLESYMAHYHNTEAALLFNSGYDANLGLLSSLPQRGDTVIHDELVHASILDGIRLSNANKYSFKHNDLNSLEQKLRNAKGTCYIVVESVYSMDGDIAPLTPIADLTLQYGAGLIVDEAHAIGVFGKGLINQLQLEHKIFAQVITFGKAMGCHGAVVLGSKNLRNYLINFARSFIYTTAAPFHQLAAIKMAYKLLNDSKGAIDHLHGNIGLYDSLMPINHNPLQSSAIKTVVTGGNDNTRQIALQIQEQGFDVRPILSPTVPAGTERLRICLHSYNTLPEITDLINIIKPLLHA